MYKNIITLTSIYFIIQFCFVAGFPSPGNPGATKETPDAKAKDVKPATEGAAKTATEAAKAVEGAAKAAEGAADKAATEAAKVAEAGAKATEAVAKAGAEEVGKLTQPSSSDDLGGPPTFTPEMLASLVQALQSNVTPTSPPSPPSADQMLNLLAANSQNPNYLADTIKNLPNPTDFVRSLYAWLGPSSQMLQNTIDGLTDIHMRNRQPGVELMRALSEPGAILLRGIFAPFGQSDRVNIVRSATLKGISDNFDNGVQISKAVADGIPEVMQRFQTQANGLMNMNQLTF